MQDKTPDEWQNVFFITASVYLIGGILYGLLASGERQEWSKIDHDEEELVINFTGKKPEIKMSTVYFFHLQTTATASILEPNETNGYGATQ